MALKKKTKEVATVVKVTPPRKQDQATVNEVRDTVSKTFNLGGEESSEDDDSRIYNAHETQKIILIKTLDQKYIRDMTKLNADEIEDIENARMLNIIAKNPLIEQMCDDHMHLRRSESNDDRSLVTQLFDWSGRQLHNLESISPLSRVLGKKGSS